MIVVGQRLALTTSMSRAVVERLVGEQRPLREIDQVRADVGERLALLVDIEEPAGRRFGTPATSFRMWCTLSM